MPDRTEPSLPADPASQADPGSVLAHSRFIEAITRHAETTPDQIAVAEIGDRGETIREITFAQLAALAADRAELLRVSTSADDAVIAILPSGIDFVALFIAAIAAGVTFVPMHTQVAGVEALNAALLTRARLAVIAPDFAAVDALNELRFLNLAHRVEQPIPPRVLRTLRARPGAIVLGSSGTTGLPKLALRSSASLDADAANVIRGMSLTADDCVLISTPLSHSYGVDLLLAALTAGASMHIVPRFDAEVLASQMTQHATVLPGVPFIFEALARVPRTAPCRVRLAFSAGASLPERVRREFFSAWGLEIGQLYGATELGTVCMDIPGTPGFDPASIGRPLPGVSMRIVDSNDPARILATGIEGELAIAAHSMLSGYLNGDVPTIDDHLLTGDLARIDAHGRVFITGRKKLLIDVGTYKVNPLEVEAELVRHPEIAECVVVPLVLSDTIQRLRAVCVPRHADRPPTTDELRAFLRTRLSPDKVPRVIEFVAALPRSTTGKVQRDQV